VLLVGNFLVAEIWVMHSLNSHWTLADFHARVAALAAIKDGARVLDLGCGRGFTLPHLIAQIGKSGEVVAADRISRSLAEIREGYHDDIAKGRLTDVDLNIAGPLPFATASFGSVVCQNVIECIPDRKGLLAEIHRILRPGGSAVIGHYDFDGVLLASDDRELTRRMVHGYADHTDKWQDVSEGQMGRLLPGLVANSPFKETETETVLFVDLSLSKDSYARDHLERMVSLSNQFGVSTKLAMTWLRRLEARSGAGTFYYALPWTYVTARAV
jgi:ubiquinone/menaquinone biosynthesis C-methylase UbiE